MKTLHLYPFTIGENIFPAILDTLEESLFLIDNKFQFTWHNEACGKLYHSVSGKPIGNNFDLNELLTAEQQFLFKDHLIKALTGQKTNFEWSFRNSITKWLSVSLYPFTADNGKFTGICGSLRDITEKKINEQILLRNTTVLNSISEGIVLVDTDFNILTFNRRAYDMIVKIDGRLRLGENFIRLLPAERRIQAVRSLHAAFLGEHVEYEELYASGFWILINCHPVRNDSGDIKHVSISFRNITERRRSEDRLKASEKKYRSLVNSLSEGVILQTLDKTILTVNKNAELILGLTSAELMQGGFPYPAWSIVDKNEQDIPHEEFFCKKNGRINPLKGKIVGIRKNNHVQWLRLNVTGVSNSRNDEPYALVISFEDITEQKRISAEMQILTMVVKEANRRMEEERMQNQIERQKEITRATLQGQEAERNDLGRELHDNVNQLLAAINLQLCYCIKNYKIAKPVILESRNNILQAMKEIRSLSHKMVMPRFSATSLQEELKRVLASYCLTYDIQLEATEWDEKTVPHFIKETFFRIAQEKLNNIHKHAQAKQITILIKTDAGFAFMCIKDNGIGFDTTQEKKGIGITNIFNRVEAYNGACELISAQGMGCTLSVRIPY